MTDLPSCRGLKAKPILERPEPLWTDWIEPASLGDALSLHLNRHGESAYHLHRSITHPSDTFDRATLRSWIEGRRIPRGVASLEILGRIEVRYRLPEGYFRSKLPHPGRALLGHKIDGITAAEMRRLAWHLPDDFNQRPERERQEIVAWVRAVIISGATDYRRYQAEAIRHRYAVRFPTLTGRKAKIQMTDLDDVSGLENADPELLNAAVDAPARLASEMAALIRFKTATLTDIGFQRSGVWCEETSSQKIEHLGLMFGALAASPKSPPRKLLSNPSML